jgi:hypothetical protein
MMTPQELLDLYSKMGLSVRNEIKNISLTGLRDTPTGYVNHNGDYLVVNDSEDGVGFSGIEKIAQDLEDFGFAGGEGVSEFSNLTDTPSEYVDAGGKYLVVNDGEDSVGFSGIEKIAQDLEDFGFAGGEGASEFSNLTDTPSEYVDAGGKYLVVNDGEDSVGFSGIEKIAQDLEDFGFAGGEGASEFSNLTDTPSEYTNQAGKYVRVGQNEDGLEFVASSELLGLGSVDGYDFCADFHLQSNTTNNSASFQDLSYNSLSISAQLVRHSTASTIFGSSSLLFDGDGRLSVGDLSSFKVISSKLISNYTIQCWVKPVLGSQNQPILGTAGQSSDHGFRLILRTDNKLEYNIFKGLVNDSGVTLVSSTALTINDWSHIALVNNNNVLTFYINGAARGTVDFTNGGSNVNLSLPLQIGGLPLSTSSMSFFNGFMQDIRIDRAAFNPQYFPPEDLSQSECNANQSELTFSSLKDTPVNYSNAGGKYVRVSENESDLEFVAITIAGSTNNQFSNSYLSEDVTTNVAINEFNFGGLDIGKTYRLSSTVALNADSSSDFPKIDFYNGDRKIVSLFSKGSTSTVSNSMLFIARDTTIYASGRDLTNSAYIMGDPEISFMQLELPPSVAVELDEEVIQPPTTGPGAGIFTISDIKTNTIIEDQGDLIDFTDILEQKNKDLGLTGIYSIGDIKLQTNMHIGEDFDGYKELFTGVPLDKDGNELPTMSFADIKANILTSEDVGSTYNLFNIIPIFTDLKISDIKLGASVSVEHPTISNFGNEMPLFSVLNISDMKLAASIHKIEVGQDKTTDFPANAFDWTT